jgi:hypothetical protein
MHITLKLLLIVANILNLEPRPETAGNDLNNQTKPTLLLRRANILLGELPQTANGPRVCPPYKVTKIFVPSKKTATQQANAHHVVPILTADYYFSEASFAPTSSTPQTSQKTSSPRHKEQ